MASWAASTDASGTNTDVASKVQVAGLGIEDLTAGILGHAVTNDQEEVLGAAGLSEEPLCCLRVDEGAVLQDDADWGDVGADEEIE